ncbi:MAG: nucleotide sugar dehydrogenase [Anaerolineae bacterium]|nr:nucleotide sugar dehydrogenase [Anaerolineae bacterium]
MKILDFIPRIEDRSLQIGVIGLGYVGFSLASMMAKQGFQVLAVDIDEKRVDAVNKGGLPIGGEEPGMIELVAAVTKSGKLRASTDYQVLNSIDVVVICVDTPVDPLSHYPTYRALNGALTSLGQVMMNRSDDLLVIVESTIAPGTMTSVVMATLKQIVGNAVGHLLFGHCPERVTPGKLLHNLVHVSRTVGGQTPEIVDVMKKLYGTFVCADLDGCDLLTAEIVKTAENAYRDVQIAFANELAMICENLGADVYSVREFVNKSPGRSVHMPGAGVGGHCIPKDPWLLIANVREHYEANLIQAARAVNNHMPYHMVTLVERALAANGIELSAARIGVLGYAFREDTDDDRDSPTTYFVDELQRRGAVPIIHDPYVRAYQRPLKEVVQGAHALVLMAGHSVYRNLDWDDIRQHMVQPILVDGRHYFDPYEITRHGFQYYGVGYRDNRLK